MALLDQLRTIRSARTAGAGATGALGKLAQIRATRKRSRLTTLPELQQESEELEALQQATGANEIAQDQPGFFARTLDVLQGFNFATAGFADEIAQGRGLGSATARATRELLSSARSLPLLSSIIPDVEAQKETFGQVLESAGVGTVTLGDALPALEGTWFGSFVNTRGTLGLALDIATDPLSYFHFGLGGAIRKTFTGLGTKLLTKRGQKLVSGELSTIRKSLDDPRKAQEILLGAGEDVIGLQSRQAGRSRALGIGRLEAADEATEGVLQRLAFDQAIEKHGADAILDQGGIKWWGRPVVKGKTLRAITSKFGDPATKALERFKWGSAVITGAEKTYQGMRKVITGIFHHSERLADLPESTREFVIAAARRMRKGEALLAGRYTARVMDSDWFKFFQDNPKLVEGSVSAIEDGAVNGIQNEAQRVASRGVSDFLEELGEDAVALGMITPEQFSTRGGNYFAHFFENNPEEFTEVWQSWAGRLSQVSGKHNKERVFETLKDAERISELLNRVQTVARKNGIAIAKTPALSPDYNLAEVLGRYVRWYSSGKARRLFAQEVSDQFGVPLEKLTSERIQEIFSFFEPGTLNPQTAAKVTNYVEGPQTSPVKGKMDPVHEIIEAEGRDLDKELIGQAVNATPEIGTKSVLRPMTTVERRFIDGLPADGKREYFRQVLKAMNSDSQVVDYLGKYGKEYEEFVPKLRMDLAGSTEDVFTRFGETASEYVLRGGNNEIWGKDPMFMPRLIADYVDDADRRLINSKDFPAMASALKSVNWVNSTFKIGVYPFFPASAARDLYSNVWFNSFRIGWHAFDPRLWVQSLKVLAHAQGSPKIVRGLSKALGAVGWNPDEIVTKSGRRISAAQAADELQRRNVMLTGRELLEIDSTGKASILPRPGAGARVGRAADVVLREVREPIDNASRVALGVQNLIDDLTFDDAAEEVARYLFNYNEIPGFSREVVTAFVPFARFTLKNIEFHYNMLRRQPGAVGNRLKPFAGREDEKGGMVKFRSEALMVRLDRDGKRLRALNGIDLPTRNLDTLWRGNVPTTMRMAAGMLSPLFKIPIEQVSDLDLFTGQKGPRVNSQAIGRFFDGSGAPQWAKDWVGYRKRTDAAGRPKYSFDRGAAPIIFLKGWAFSRVISTTDRQFREYAGDEGVASMLLDLMTGIRAEDMDLDIEERRRLHARIRELRDTLVRRGAQARFQKTFTPKTPGELR